MAEYATAFGLDGFAPGLSCLADRLENLSPALNLAGELIHASVMDNFSLQGRPRAWEPLKPATVKRKGHDTILLETGRLMNSISIRVTEDSVTLIAEVPYALTLQYGSGLKGLPARPFLVLQDADIQAIVSLVETCIVTE